MTENQQHSGSGVFTALVHRLRFLLILVSTGLIFIGGTGLYLYLSYHFPVGSGPAGPAVAQTDFAGAWTTRSVFMVGLGDSVTAGFGARKGYGYFDRLVATPVEEWSEIKGICLSQVFPHLQVTNVSMSGSVSSEVESQLAKIPRQSPETLGWVVITTGGNDLIHNYGRTQPRELAMYGATFEEAKPWIDNFSVRLETIVSGINERFPGGCHIFMADIFDPTDAKGDIERAGLPPWPDGMKILAAYNQIIGKCAEKHPNVHSVNFHDSFLGHGIHCAQFWSKYYDSKDPHYWYYTNLEDPNERGYDVIRRLFLLEMAKVGRDLQKQSADQ